MATTELLTAENWRGAVLQAIERLPEDIRSSVGYLEPDEHTFIIKVAVEPIYYELDEEERESDRSEIRIRLWDTVREQEEALLAEAVAAAADDEEAGIHGQGYESQLALYRETFPERLDWPVLSIEPGASGEATEGLFLDRARLLDLRRLIQKAICEELFCGGAVSMVCKDQKGRFVREDGSPVLRWQFRKRRPPEAPR